MTPAEHLAKAEQLLNDAEVTTGIWDSMHVWALATVALAHATIAQAAEGGVPHSAAPVGGAASGQ